MSYQKIQKKYVSDSDRLLAELRKKSPPSKAVQQEIAKHARIFDLRDNVKPTTQD